MVDHDDLDRVRAAAARQINRVFVSPRVAELYLAISSQGDGTDEAAYAMALVLALQAFAGLDRNAAVRDLIADVLRLGQTPAGFVAFERLALVLGLAVRRGAQ